MRATDGPHGEPENRVMDLAGTANGNPLFPSVRFRVRSIAGSRMPRPELRPLHGPLDRVILTGASLRGSTFAGNNLTGADLRAADLRAVNFTGCDLSYADFRGANAQGANVQNATLYRAKLQGMDLRLANLHGARIE